MVEADLTVTGRLFHIFGAAARKARAAVAVFVVTVVSSSSVAIGGGGGQEGATAPHPSQKLFLRFAQNR